MSAASLLARLPWRRRADPYEDFYLNASPADPRNQIDARIRQAPDGSVFAVKAETHTPEVMTRHVKELGRFFGADVVRIVDSARLRDLLRDAPSLDGAGDLPFAVVCGFRAEYDQREAPGIGGHVGALKAAFATFQMSAIIREYGFQAIRCREIDAEKAAAAAGLGRLNDKGRLVVPGFGTKISIGDVILTSLPVAPEA